MTFLTHLRNVDKEEFLMQMNVEQLLADSFTAEEVRQIQIACDVAEAAGRFNEAPALIKLKGGSALVCITIAEIMDRLRPGCWLDKLGRVPPLEECVGHPYSEVFKDELDRAILQGCSTPSCDHKEHSDLGIVPNCHATAGVRLAYLKENVLQANCGECGGFVVRIAIADQPDLEAPCHPYARLTMSYRYGSGELKVCCHRCQKHVNTIRVREAEQKPTQPGSEPPQPEPTSSGKEDDARKS
jgi:hypothetical protein